MACRVLTNCSNNYAHIIFRKADPLIIITPWQA